MTRAGKYAAGSSFRSVLSLGLSLQFGKFDLPAAPSSIPSLLPATPSMHLSAIPKPHYQISIYAANYVRRITRASYQACLSPGACVTDDAQGLSNQLSFRLSYSGWRTAGYHTLSNGAMWGGCVGVALPAFARVLF